MDNTTNSAVEKKALSRVPKEQRQSWYSIAFIWIGTMICIPMLMVGGLLSASMTFGNVLLACFLGFAICSVLMIMVGMQGTDLGLPSSMCGTKACPPAQLTPSISTQSISSIWTGNGLALFAIPAPAATLWHLPASISTARQRANGPH